MDLMCRQSVRRLCSAFDRDDVLPLALWLTPPVTSVVPRAVGGSPFRALLVGITVVIVATASMKMAETTKAMGSSRLIPDGPRSSNCELGPAPVRRISPLPVRGFGSGLGHRSLAKSREEALAATHGDQFVTFGTCSSGRAHHTIQDKRHRRGAVRQTLAFRRSVCRDRGNGK